jgi:UDP-GlcNAc3NAcA epimerase
MKLVNIVGARPQFIKAAVISRAIIKHNAENSNAAGGIEDIIVHSGQHYDDNMNRVFFEELEIPIPAHNLGIGSGAHGKMTGAMLEKIEAILVKAKPDGVIVYGDTNTTLAGALAAAKLHIPLAHVEAGLRSYNKRMPEEINRVVTDHISDILFCPTRTAVDNLALENISTGVFNTGDVMYDSFLFYKEMAARKSKILQTLGLTTNSYMLATVHRAENVDHAEELGQIFSAFDQIASKECPLILPLHPRTSRRLEAFKLAAGFNNNIRRIPPISYLDMVCLLAGARLILTDSGGVQKEAYFAGVPCITLRQETEWPETLAGGWNRLTGADADAIIEGYREALATADRQAANWFGQGCSGEKIVELIQTEI